MEKEENETLDARVLRPAFIADPLFSILHSPFSIPLRDLCVLRGESFEIAV
ncbi:MAG: hypothetical protein V2A79_10940 [Planctomycetota bacterium]